MNAELDDYVSMGVDWVRLDIHWTLVQPNGNGRFNWDQVDKVFNAIEDKGMNIVAVLNNTPNWVGSSLSSRSDQEAFGRFAAASAERYGDIVDHWEIFNEQNKHNITPQSYTEVLKQSYNAIKAVDGSDVVITGGTAAIPSTGNGMWGAVDYLGQMYDAGAKGYFDAVGYHPYSFPLMPSDGAEWNGWQMMEDGIRDAMVANGDGDKQVWMTEFGAKTTGGGQTVSESQAARMLRDAVDLAEDTPWAGPIMWFSYQDSSFEPGFGLRDGGGRTREAYHVFKELGTKDGGGHSAAPAPSPRPEPAPEVSPSPAPSPSRPEPAPSFGADTFVFKKAVMWETIRGFGDGDRIDLSGIDANASRSGDQAFKFIGSNWLKDAGDLGVYVDRANNKTYVQANTDRDSDFEVSIVLNGVHQLDASDFIL
ncbi:family 1 glycosylhydrolase [Paracoccus sp. Z118]|uniref:family 1 glycosylhydrolase n=1 Tax=Paracoccus sp. Z118 TaxID=2851017 RepID=UPI001C2C17FF|nr:family 1 glycosylhydrolase [Paracoccus sp. Z118]MBV0892989.1 family 1 glycosylhydrolase [Paracoccus sp. Z118]